MNDQVSEIDKTTLALYYMLVIILFIHSNVVVSTVLLAIIT